MAAKKESENAASEASTEKTYRMEDVRAMVAAMLAEEKAKAAEAEAKAKAQREQDAARMEELVEIKLFKDNGKYKDDVFVSVNGETIAIKRGDRIAQLVIQEVPAVELVEVEELSSSERADTGFGSSGL